MTGDLGLSCVVELADTARPQSDRRTGRPAECGQPAAVLLGTSAGGGPRARLRVRAKTSSPSTIGVPTAEGIPATAGFGLPYEGLHGVAERAHLADPPVAHAVYRRPVLGLLDA
ncbi:MULTISPECIES: hypothetical protein [Streptomyces]|uniref:Uncharacterized protein n=1 Tax=Streptomyces chartreusis NRRL 3882 TaxID=1079985 RepID=A0A2N9B192_STRCX|nr:hypothetical protein [Streptomyces chartreusis]SOR77107.1 hypothetical protein SCNRRL3882_0583 [Streptomyces chartreusis NRRL 3882]